MKKRNGKIYETNPFMGKALQHTVTGNRIITGTSSENMLIVSQSTGEIKGMSGFFSRMEVDRTHFIKLYLDGIKALCQLKGAGIKVFTIIYQLMMNDKTIKDRIFLRYDMLPKELQETLSLPSWYRGINELVKANILALTQSTEMFWINVDYIYRGDRLALCKEYVIKKEEQLTLLDTND